MPVVWDSAADCKLFLAILKEQNIKVDSKSISAAVSSNGLQVTPRAIEERLKKLKKMCSEGDGASGNGDGKSIPAGKSKATPRRRKANLEENEDDDEEERPTPFKKPRKGSMKKPKSKQRVASIDAENDGDEYDDDGEMLSDVKVEYADEA